MQKTIVISDLHLCDNSSANDFKKTDLLLQFFEEFRDEKIVLDGDIFECLQAPLEKIVFYNSEVVRAIINLKDKEILWGNHDHAFRKVFQETYVSGGIFIHHGHQFDIYNKDPGFIGAKVAEIIGWFERVIHHDTDEWLKGIAEYARRITPVDSEYLGDLSEYRDGAEYILKNIEDINLVIMGHTHSPSLKRVKGGLYLNVGAWTSDVEFATYGCITDETVELLTYPDKKVISQARRI